MSEFTTIKGSNSYRGSATLEYDLVHNIVSVELPTTALQTNDITWLMYIPANAIIVDGFVRSDDLDSGTSLGIVIGDATTTNLFITALTTPWTSGGTVAIANASKYLKFASANRVRLTTVTTAQTAVAGTLVFGLTYFIDTKGDINLTTGETPITITA